MGHPAPTNPTGRAAAAFIETRRAGFLWRAAASYVVIAGAYPTLTLTDGPWRGLTRRAAWRRAYRALGRPVLVTEDELAYLSVPLRDPGKAARC